jgi:rhodanese-related sulfurtransferase
LPQRPPQLRAAAQILRAHGFTKVHNLGPMTAW